MHSVLLGLLEMTSGYQLVVCRPHQGRQSFLSGSNSGIREKNLNFEHTFNIFQDPAPVTYVKKKLTLVQMLMLPVVNFQPYISQGCDPGCPKKSSDAHSTS